MPIKALIIGINEYIDSSGLSYAVNDATAVSDSLKDIYEKGIILLTDEQEKRFTPLANNIISNIQLISQNAHETDNIFFYFAGHGKEVDGEPVLLPSDYRDEIGLKAAIKIEDIKAEFEKSKAKFKLLLLDSCHSGAVKGRGDIGNMTRSMYESISDIPEGFAIISACSLDQRSYEDEKLKHGVFTHQLLEGIKGKADANNDGEITVNELYDYVTPKVSNFVFEKHRKSQTPHMRTNYSGVFVINRLPTKSNVQIVTFGTEVFIHILLETECYEMDFDEYSVIGLKPEIEEALNATERDALLVLRKTYGMHGLKKEKNRVIFKDGILTQDITTNERANLVTSKVIVGFNYLKERWNMLDNTLLELDDLRDTWKKIEFMTRKKIDFEKIENFCTKNEYEVVDISLDEPNFLTFLSPIFSGKLNLVTFTQYEDYSIILVEPYGEQGYTQNYFPQHFYTLINPKKIAEQFSTFLSE